MWKDASDVANNAGVPRRKLLEKFSAGILLRFEITMKIVATGGTKKFNGGGAAILVRDGKSG